MADEPITRHEIPYRRLFPWLRLFRSIGVASDAKALMLAALGLVLLHAGWEGHGTTFLHALLAAVWGVAVWGLFGGAIARIAVVQLARSERTGMAAALRFAGRKWFPLIGAPLGPLVAVAPFAAFCAAFGLLY